MISFFVHGIPQPKGSSRAFYIPKLKRAIVTAANPKTKPWEACVRAAAIEAGCAPTSEAVTVTMRFWFPRPKGHFRTNGQIRPSAPAHFTKTPDLDKLTRAVNDGLIACAFDDDSRVSSLLCSKHYCNASQPTPGVEITIDAALLPHGQTRPK